MSRRRTPFMCNIGAFYVGAAGLAAIWLGEREGRWLPHLSWLASAVLLMLIPSALAGGMLSIGSWRQTGRRRIGSSLVFGVVCASVWMFFTTSSDWSVVAGASSFGFTSPVSNEVDLTWPAATDNGYEIYRSRFPLLGMWLHAQPGSNHYQDYGLRPSTTYYYRIVAVFSDHKQPVGTIAATTGADAEYPVAGPEREESPAPRFHATAPNAVQPDTIVKPSRFGWILTRPIPFVVSPLLFGAVLSVMTRQKRHHQATD